MAKSSNDEVIRQMRESRKKKIQICSTRAAEKVLAITARPKAKSKPTVQTVAEMIAEEFDELVG
jgi:hypothetical protein